MLHQKTFKVFSSLWQALRKTSYRKYNRIIQENLDNDCYKDVKFFKMYDDIGTYTEAF